MQSKTLQPYFLLAILGGAFILAFYILKPFLVPLILAAIFAVVLQPVYRFFIRRFGGYESVASGATVLAFAVVILIPATLISFQLFREAQQLYVSVSQEGAGEVFGGLVEQFEDSVASLSPAAAERLGNLRADIDAYAQQALNWIVQHTGAAFSGALTFFLNTFIFVIALYYLLRDGHLLTRRIIELSPLSDRDDSVILKRLETSVNSVIKGQLAIALIQGTLSGIGMAIFGVPNAMIWGLVAAVAALVPSFGTTLVLAPAVAYLALTGSLASAIGLGIWGATAVGLVDNLLGPRLISSGLHLHPLLVILAVIGGVLVFGPVGIFLGPITMSLLIVLLSIYRELTQRAE